MRWSILLVVLAVLAIGYAGDTNPAPSPEKNSKSNGDGDPKPLEAPSVNSESQSSDELKEEDYTLKILTSAPTTELEDPEECKDFHKIRPELVSREIWGAQPAKSKVPIQHPVDHLWLIYSTNTDFHLMRPCYNFSACAADVRQLQAECLKRDNLADVPFNFMIGGDGRVYEGRGWDTQPPTYEVNPELGSRRLEIAFLGDLCRDRITSKMALAALYLEKYGVDNKYVRGDYVKKEWLVVGMEQPEEPGKVDLELSATKPPSMYTADVDV